MKIAIDDPAGLERAVARRWLQNLDLYILILSYV